MKRRGQGLSITTIIVAAIALVVLVILIAIFTGRIALFQRGVGETGACAGLITCSDFQSANDCEGVGCTWDPQNTPSCSGTANRFCVSYTTQSNCEAVGCTWRAD
ncbi:MAG: hypothetical protein KAT77_02150 [Nanoarchaeota archaeon]|nr:hypothetical protein [Nanoarchaeota archaeon]